MAKTTSNHPLGKKLDRVIYLLEFLLALGLNRTNLNRNEIQARLIIDKTEVNKMLNGIKRDNSERAKIKGHQKKAKLETKKKK